MFLFVLPFLDRLKQAWGTKFFGSVISMAGKKKQVRLTKAELIQRMKEIQERK